MILTPISPECLGERIAALSGQLPAALHPILTRLTLPASREIDLDRDHAAAVALAARFGMAPEMIDPADSFSWDGHRVAALTEPSVLLHEVAHYQLAAPARRKLHDFGLGAGPETGKAGVADAAQRLHGLAREREESMASLLGMLWEAELGQSALAAFQEQNWLEGADRAGTAAVFAAIAEALLADGFVDQDGTPQQVLRSAPDEPEIGLPA